MSNKDDLMKTAEQDPVAAAILCQIELEKLEKGYHEQLYYLLAVAYAIAYQMQWDNEAWKSFIQDPFWRLRTKRPRAKHRHRALLHVLVFVFKATAKQRYDRAQKYSVGLELLMKEGTSPEQILPLLEVNGIELYIREGTARRKQSKRERDSEEDEISDSYFDDLNDDPRNDTQDAGGDPQNNDTSNDDAQKQKGANPKSSQRDELAKDVDGTVEGQKHGLVEAKLTGTTKVLRTILQSGTGDEGVILGSYVRTDNGVSLKISMAIPLDAAPRRLSERRKPRRQPAKKLAASARPSGDKVSPDISRKSSKKPTLSRTWMTANIQPDHPDTYWGPYHWDTTVPEAAPTRWTTYSPKAT